jgi:tripartite-type tricarboxylate transporter receptor subunit TctC
MGALLRVACVAASLSFCSMAVADPIADFYAQRTITIIVGSDVGGGYDTQGHLMARHLGNYIPGHPAVVVQNMPGAGSMIAANYVYNLSPKDGTTIGLIQCTLLTANLANQKGVRFDVEKFNWIGNLAAEVPLFISWHTSPVKTIADLFQREMVMGGGGATSDSEVQARMLNALIGTKIKIVSGYTGQAQIQLAMERGEVEGMGGWDWSNLKSRNSNYLSDHKVNILLQGAAQRAVDLPNVPTPFDFVKNVNDRKILELFYAQQAVTRPIAAPPDIPADRLAALRKAFIDMVGSREFQADARNLRLEASATSYESIENVLRLIASIPPDTAERFAEFDTPPK